MKVLIDISHPAHVHFYRHIRRELITRGVDVIVVAREKDVTLELLKAYDIPFVSTGRAGHRNWLGQLGELIVRDAFLVREGLRFRPDVILTRNPSGVQAARVLGAVGVFDTDDGRSVGIHYKAAAPFAHWITAPDCLTESLGRGQKKYPSYKSLAYLHPDVFHPDSEISDILGIKSGEAYALVRLVAHNASHDRLAEGLGPAEARRLIEILEQSMRVFVSAERRMDGFIEERRLRAAPEKMHDVLSGASMVVGDSQSVIAEAAVLGTPAIRINSYAGATPYLVELQDKYRLAYSFSPDALDSAIRLMDELLHDPSTGAEWSARRAMMLNDKANLVTWYVDFVLSLGSSQETS